MKLQDYVAAVHRIRERCACRNLIGGARECYASRYGAFKENDDDPDDGECECFCHDEIAALEEDADDY